MLLYEGDIEYITHTHQLPERVKGNIDTLPNSNSTLILNDTIYKQGSVINPQPEGYSSRFVVHSFIRSVHCTTESSAHFFAPVKV